MWQALYQAFNNFWNPTPELRATMALPFRERIKQLAEWSYWRANFRWPVIWRRAVVIFVGIQLCNVGYLTVRGFQTVALERQERAGAANALERAAQQVWTAKPGSAQDLQGRQNMKKALSRIAASAKKPLVDFLAEVTRVEINPFSQFDVDKGFGDLCGRLRLNLCEQTDAATHRARLNVGTLYCQVSAPCWDDLSPAPPAQHSNSDDWTVVSVDGRSNADAAGMTASERAQGIAKYCRGRAPEEMNDAEVFFSTAEEFRVLERFKCWK